MSEFTKIMASIERRLTSRNRIPVYRTTITAKEFKLIGDEIEKLEREIYAIKKVCNVAGQEFSEKYKHL